MKKVQIIINSESGLHARPASVFVQEAKRFKSQITLRNLALSSAPVDAKSILAVLTLGVEKDHNIEIEANGSDEDQAIDQLEELIKSGFPYIK